MERLYWFSLCNNARFAGLVD